MEIGVGEAKNHLPKLIKAALRGEQVIISNRGKPVVELVRVKLEERKSRLGTMRDIVASLPPGWDSPAEKGRVTALFENLE